MRLFWVKMISGNHFHPFPHVWLSRKMIFFGKWLPVDQYFHLWPGNDFLPSFSLQSISGKREGERERACARERRRNQTVSPPIVGGLWAPGGADLQSNNRREDRDRWRDLATHRSRDRAVASLRRVDREIAPSRARAASITRSRRRDRYLGSRSLMIFFLGLSFPSSFPNIRKYFPENFLKCNQTHGNIFLFWKLAFPENMYFPENVLRQPNTAISYKESINQTNQL